VLSIATEVKLYEGYFHAIMARFDQLEHKLESLIEKVIDEVKDGNEPKDLPLNEFFSTFCALKAWNENHPSAKGYKSSLNWFFRFLRKRYPEVRSLRELTPIMISEYIKYHKERHIFSKRHNQWEKLSERTINAHIKKLRHALETVDSRGTQELRERLITIKRPRLKKNLYIPTDEELTKIPELLKRLRESRREDHARARFTVDKNAIAYHFFVYSLSIMVFHCSGMPYQFYFVAYRCTSQHVSAHAASKNLPVNTKT